MDAKAGSALAATLIALTSCGGGESGGAADAPRPGAPAPEARLSKAQLRYVAQVDAACKEGDEISGRTRGQMGAVQGRGFSREEMNRRVAEILDKSFVESDRIRRRIRGIEAPPGEERFRRRYLEYSERLDALNKRAMSAIARDEDLRGDDYLSLRREARRVTKQRGALVADHGGFRYCG